MNIETLEKHFSKNLSSLDNENKTLTDMSNKSFNSYCKKHVSYWWELTFF